MVVGPDMSINILILIFFLRFFAHTDHICRSIKKNINKLNKLILTAIFFYYFLNLFKFKQFYGRSFVRKDYRN